MLRYSFGTLTCKNAIFLQKVNLVAALMQNYKQRNVSIKLDIKLNNRQTGTLGDCIHFKFKEHFTFSHWIFIHIFLGFLHTELVCFLSGEDVYRLKFTRCIFKTPAGFERAAALTGREHKITAVFF